MKPGRLFHLLLLACGLAWMPAARAHALPILASSQEQDPVEEPPQEPEQEPEQDPEVGPQEGVEQDVEQIVEEGEDDTATGEPEKLSKAEKTRLRMIEVFGIRNELLLTDLETYEGFEEETLDALRVALDEVNQSFWEDKKLKTAVNNNTFHTEGQAYSYTPYAKMIASDEWAQACEATLDPAQLGALRGRMELRETRVEESLEQWIRARIAHGLCLTPEECTGMDEVIGEVATQIMDGSLIIANVYYYNQNQNDQLPKLLKDAGLGNALADELKPIVEDIDLSGRLGLHDMQLEAEFFLRALGDQGERRSLLHGCAQALMQRGDVKQRAKGATSNLAPRMRLEKVDFWTKSVLTILELGEDQELPTPPSRDSEPLIDTRTEFLLAIIDQRAFLSDDQRDSLRPLMHKFVKQESTQGQRGSFFQLHLPQAFGFSRDGMLVGANRFNQPSTKVRAMIQAVIETCTQDQKDALGV